MQRLASATAPKAEHAALDVALDARSPKPRALSRHKRSRSRSKLPPALYDILYVYPASFRNLVALLVVAGILFWLFAHILLLVWFMLVDSLFSGWLGANHLALRKQPLVFVHSPWSAAVVWETTQDRFQGSARPRGIGLRYWKKEPPRPSHRGLVGGGPSPRQDLVVPRVAVVKPEGREGRNRWVHSVVLEPLESGQTYVYELVLEDGLLDPASGAPKVLKSYGEYSFTWLGINPPDAAMIEHLAFTSVTTAKALSPVQMVFIGDTHSSPSSLAALVNKYLNLKSYVHHGPEALFSPRNLSLPVHQSKPHLVAHLGNMVEDTTELKQWQTEFWDPITFQNKQSSEIPIIYARGPRDFDVKGRSIYTAGLPPVQLGEVNRTRVALLKNQKNRVILPGISIADRQYTALRTMPRDPRTRGTFFGYSPHPRVRVIVLDSNLAVDRQAFYQSRSTLTEVGDHEHWLLWEMARPEWKDASIRMIVVSQAPFVEYADHSTWEHEKAAQLAHYVRKVFAPHFHAKSDITRMYDIPPATMVVSSNPYPAYSRGLLRNYVAPYLFSSGPSSNIPQSLLKQIEMERFSDLDPHSQALDDGVIYVVSPGSGKLHGDPVVKVENWGFYESSQSRLRQHKARGTRGGGADYFSPVTLDMAPDEFKTDDDWLNDSHENAARRDKWSSKDVRVYRIMGSQRSCPVKYAQGDHHIKRYTAVDRLYWRTLDTKGRLVDQFVIEAASCR